MILNFNTGTRNGNWYAFWNDPDGKMMEGPARDTEVEALVDRDRAVKLAAMTLLTSIPGAVITVRETPTNRMQ